MMRSIQLAAIAAVCAGALAMSVRPMDAQGASHGRIVRPNATLHVVADLNRSISFYRDMVGLEADSDNAFPSGRSPELATLVNAPGADVRTATFTIPGTEVRLVLVQFTSGGGSPIDRRLQDFGQIKTVLRVRDIDAQFAKMQKGATGVFTSGGAPVRPEGPQGINRAVIMKDPDGAPVELVYQTVPPIPDTIPAASNIVGGWASFIVEDLPATIEFYKTQFGFDIRGEGRQASPALLALQGLPDATTTMSTGARIPGAAYTWFLYAYSGVEKRGLSGHLSQPGMTALSFYVDDVTTMLRALKGAGVRPETQSGEPVKIGGVERVVVRDPSGILIELVGVN
jgi:catechol 2,3-dioxygenase-like lactoylglutathione lyase family enzyme